VGFYYDLKLCLFILGAFNVPLQMKDNQRMSRERTKSYGNVLNPATGISCFRNFAEKKTAVNLTKENLLYI